MDVQGEIVKQLTKANDIAIFCHTNPDGDALGSMLALAHALRQRGKKVGTFCDMPVPAHYNCLDGSELVSLPDNEAHELAVSVDCADADRLGKCIRSFMSAKKQICIDHHKSFSRFAEICYVDGNAAACAQLVYDILDRMKALDDTSAKLLFGAIVTDSGCFAYSSVTAETFKIAQELKKYDFDSADCVFKVFRSTSLARFKLKSRVLNKAKFFEDGKIALIVFDHSDFEATGTSFEDTEGVISELMDIDCVKIAYAISEVSKMSFKVSIRTRDSVDASEIASRFGGGGHRNAAGCRLNGFLEDVVEKLLNLAKQRV